MQLVHPRKCYNEAYILFFWSTLAMVWCWLRFFLCGRLKDGFHMETLSFSEAFSSIKQ